MAYFIFATTAGKTAEGTSMTDRILGPLGVKAMENRGIDPEIAVRLEIHTAHSEDGHVVPDPAGNVIVFPFLENGVVVAEKYRAAGKRFWQKAGGKRTFYNVDALDDPALLDGSMALTICEGEIDCLTAMTVGFPLAVSVPDGAPPPSKEEKPVDLNADESGKFSFLWESKDRLKRIQKFIIAVDNDAPGKHLADELVRRLGAARCSFVTYPEGCKDINDVLMKHGADAAHAVLAEAKPYPLKGVHPLSDYPDKPQIKTFSTGWSTVDTLFTPFVPSCTVITGLPGSGKSTWVTNLAINMADLHGWKWAIFSPELPVVPHYRDKMRRIICGESVERLTREHITKADHFINAHFVFIDHDVTGADDADVTVEWLMDRAYDALMRYGIRGWIFDPWNEAEHAKGRNESMSEYVNRMLRTLIKFCRRHGIALFILAHPTKEVGKDGKSRVPTLYDIADSAAFFNKPDFGIVIDRPDPNQDRTHIHVKKVRFENTGDKGAVVLAYNRGNSRFELLDAVARSL